MIDVISQSQSRLLNRNISASKAFGDIPCARVIDPINFGSDLFFVKC